MRHRQCAASGTLACVLLMGGIGIGGAQAPTASVADFDTRFHFQLNIPSAESGLPNSGSLETKQAPNQLEELPISPAEAASAPSADAPSAVQQSDGKSTKPLRGIAAGLKQPIAQRPLLIGRAAYYEHPGRTASGEKYDPDGLTAAHRKFALGTRLRVVNLQNQRSVVVRVNDRSPAKMNFAIDLSRGSANAIGITKRGGTGLVAIYKLD